MGELDGHDGVGARGQRRAGRDRHGRVRLEPHGIVAGERPARDRQLAAGVGGAHGDSRPWRSCRTAAGRARRARRRRRRGPSSALVSASVSAGSGESRSSSSARASSGSSGRGSGAATGPCYKGPRGRRPRRSGGGARPLGPGSSTPPAAPCWRSRRTPAIAGPAWWDANAPARRVTYVARASSPLPPAPWPARRALDFCAELALALAPLHEAGAAHGALRPRRGRAAARRRAARARARRPGGPAGRPPRPRRRAAPPADRPRAAAPARRRGRGRARPREAAALLQGLLADDPGAAARLARARSPRGSRAIAAAVPDTTPAAEPAPAHAAAPARAPRAGARPARRRRRRRRLRRHAARRPARPRALADDRDRAGAARRHALTASPVLRRDHDRRRRARAARLRLRLLRLLVRLPRARRAARGL